MVDETGQGQEMVLIIYLHLIHIYQLSRPRLQQFQNQPLFSGAPPLSLQHTLQIARSSSFEQNMIGGGGGGRGAGVPNAAVSWQFLEIF